MRCCIGIVNALHILHRKFQTDKQSAVMEPSDRQQICQRARVCGLVILPVYEISAIADALIINSIEFWSGTNPIEAGTKTVTSDNERYLVAWDNTGYKITNETTGEETRFNFDADTNSWALATPEGDITILTFIDDTHVKVPTHDGSSTIVELSDNGVLAYKDLVGYNNVLLAKK